MKLPEKFQMRNVKYPGFTHVVTATLGHNYKSTSKEFVSVKWARGYAEEIGGVPNKLVRIAALVDEIKAGTYILVDDKPVQKKQEEALPDVFYFRCDPQDDPEVFKATKSASENYHITWESSVAGINGMNYSAYAVQKLVEEGSWKIIDKKPLAAVQQRANKEHREQIAALESSIKLNEQDIEHKKRLIASYEQRKSDLLKKIVEE